MTESIYQPKDYKNPQAVRWCPGCGYSFPLNSLHKAMAELGYLHIKQLLFSGIRCFMFSALHEYLRFPYHSWSCKLLIATGVKSRKPQIVRMANFRRRIIVWLSEDHLHPFYS